MAVSNRCKIAILYIGVGKYKKQPRTAFLRRDRLNLKKLVQNTKELEFSDAQATDKDEWDEHEILNKLAQFRNTIKKDEYTAYFTIVVAHGGDRGHGSYILTSNNISIAYDTIIAKFCNTDLPKSAQRKPRVVLLYSCQGSLRTEATDVSGDDTHTVYYRQQGNAPQKTASDGFENQSTAASIESGNLAPKENVFYLEPAESSYILYSHSIRMGTPVVMSLVNFIQQNINKNKFTVSRLMQQIVVDIKGVHKYEKKVIVDPVAHITSGPHYITLTGTSPNPPKIDIDIEKLFDGIKRKRESEDEKVQKTQTFLKHSLSQHFTQEPILHIFECLAGYERFVPFPVFTRLFTKDANPTNLWINVLSIKEMINNLKATATSHDNDISNIGVDAVFFEQIYLICQEVRKMGKYAQIKHLVASGELHWLPVSLRSLQKQIRNINNGDLSATMAPLNELIEFGNKKGTPSVMICFVAVQENGGFGGCVFIQYIKKRLFVSCCLEHIMSSLCGGILTSFEFATNDVALFEKKIFDSELTAEKKIKAFVLLKKANMYDLKYKDLLEKKIEIDHGIKNPKIEYLSYNPILKQVKDLYDIKLSMAEVDTARKLVQLYGYIRDWMARKMIFITKHSLSDCIGKCKFLHHFNENVHSVSNKSIAIVINAQPFTEMTVHLVTPNGDTCTETKIKITDNIGKVIAAKASAECYLDVLSTDREWIRIEIKRGPRKGDGFVCVRKADAMGMDDMGDMDYAMGISMDVDDTDSKSDDNARHDYDYDDEEDGDLYNNNNNKNKNKKKRKRSEQCPSNDKHQSKRLKRATTDYDDEDENKSELKSMQNIGDDAKQQHIQTDYDIDDEDDEDMKDSPDNNNNKTDVYAPVWVEIFEKEMRSKGKTKEIRKVKIAGGEKDKLLKALSGKNGIDECGQIYAKLYNEAKRGGNKKDRSCQYLMNSSATCLPIGFLVLYCRNYPNIKAADHMRKMYIIRRFDAGESTNRCVAPTDTTIISNTLKKLLSIMATRDLFRYSCPLCWETFKRLHANTGIKTIANHKCIKTKRGGS